MANPIAASGSLPASTGTELRSGTRPAARTDTGAVQTGRQAVAGSGNGQPAAARETQSVREIAEATRDISEYIQTVSRSLQISIDRQLDVPVVTVLDAETEQVVRQIPAEELLQIARFIEEQQMSAEAASAVRGLLMDQQG